MHCRKFFSYLILYGNTDPTVTLGGYYGAGRGPIFYYRCRGAEDSLTNCYPSISTRCSHQNDAGIECIGNIIDLRQHLNVIRS